MTSTKQDIYGRNVIESIPVSGIRKIIGERMKESLQRSPQGTAMVKADMSNLIDFRDKCFEKNIQVSFNDLYIKIASLALQENPMFNSSLQENHIYIFESIDIGFAVYIDRSLFVPVIKNCQDKTLSEISTETKTIIKDLKDKKMQNVTISGSTFTVNNMGMLEIDGFTPFINPPEAAILGIGKTRKEVVVEEDDSIRIKPMTTLSLTNDHAIIDGVPVGELFGTIKTIMANPNKYLSI